MSRARQTRATRPASGPRDAGARRDEPVRPASDRLVVRSLGNGYLQETAAPRAAISAGGAGTVSIRYSPEAGDTSTKIVFIQVMHELLDGTPVKPSAAHASFAYQDADTTADLYHVDFRSGEADPYYNGDDVGKDSGTQGKAGPPKVDADMTDTPDYRDGHFPPGKTTLTWEFRTIAFSAAGPDKGTYYAYARWTYDKVKGSAATISHQGTSADTSLPKSRAAITLWASNHGFALPT
jgi:hypothetical protein